MGDMKAAALLEHAMPDGACAHPVFATCAADASGLGQEGWRAQLDLQFEQRQGRTALVRRAHVGPMMVQRPFHPEGAPCHTYVLHPPGGVVGGDHLDLHAHVGADAHALITMPGATKFYRSDGQQALLRQTCTLAAGATLEWLAQDTIHFNGAHSRMQTRFTLDEGARLIAWEVQCLGRPSLAERFETGSLNARLELEYLNRPLLIESLNLQGGQMARVGGHPLCATMLVFPATDAVLDAVRQEIAQFDGAAGATRMDELLVLRLLSDDNQAIQQCLHACWRAIRPMVLGIEACPPRIWAT